jgi:hypothetical protein
MGKQVVSRQGTATPSTRQDVDAFLAKVGEIKKASGRGRLIFGMDATMSRQPTWDRAAAIQSDMFIEAARVGSLAIQLCYFRGHRESKVSKWITDGPAMARLMSKVQCQGGYTQIHRLLQHIKSETTKERVSAAVFVGDAMEENVDAVCAMAGEIGLLGTPVFMFQEGDDGTATQAFKEVARLTGGAYFKLDHNSANQLAEVLRAVAAYAAGGSAALEDHANKSASAKHLLKQLKS